MSPRRIGIHQPNYWPWVGYWRKMAQSDVFVLFDDVQLPQGKSFVTRTRIKTANGESWLTVPVEHKGALSPIADVIIASGSPWERKHWRTIEGAYRKAPHFDEHAARVGALFDRKWERLIDLNVACIEVARDLLGIRAELVTSSSLGIASTGTDRIVDIVAALDGDIYVTGTGAGSARYMDEQAFADRGILVEPVTFEHPVYPQPWGDFVANLSVLDFLFNCGKDGWDRWMLADHGAAG